MPKIRIQGTHLSGHWFPFCKMRELTLYIPIIGFITCEATFQQTKNSEGRDHVGLFHWRSIGLGNVCGIDYSHKGLLTLNLCAPLSLK